MKTRRLGEVAHVQLGKMLSPAAKAGTAPFPYLRNQDVQWGRINVAALPSMDFSPTERVKFSLRPGDLLACEGGEPGRCAVWQGELEPCYFQKALLRIRPINDRIDTEFLMYWLRQQAIAGAFAHKNAKTTIAHLPRTRLLDLSVPDLSLQEQRRLAERIKAQLAAAEEVRIAAEAQIREIERLPGRILAQAFGD